MFKIHEKIINFIAEAMKNSKAEIKARGKKLLRLKFKKASSREAHSDYVYLYLQ